MLQSKFARQLLFAVPIWLGLEYILSYLAASFFVDASDRWWSALLIMGAFYLFRIINSFVNSILKTVMYYISKKQRIDSIVALFYANKVPVIDAMISKDGAIEVLQALQSDEQSSDKVKAFASVALGELAGIRLSNSLTLFMQTQYIIEAAIARYVAENNARAVGRFS